MNEFMFLIRNRGDQKAAMSPEDHKNFVTACEVYIGRLKAEGRLIAAQPLVREGRIISGKAGAWQETSFDASGEMQVGYYHIYAADLDEAVALAKDNPEFAYGTTASIEVRPIKTKEKATGFEYPKA